MTVCTHHAALVSDRYKAMAGFVNDSGGTHFRRNRVRVQAGRP
jgi:hypothetical protein